MPFLGGEMRDEVGKDVYSFCFEDVTVLFRSRKMRADVLAVIAKDDDYKNALSAEDMRAIYTTQIWLGVGNMAERHNKFMGEFVGLVTGR